jgi:hypothetical protein
MKIKIDNEGCLWIERAGKMKAQICPYDENWTGCGDWCPLFHELDIDGKPALELCRAYYPADEIEELKDERGGE